MLGSWDTNLSMTFSEKGHPWGWGHASLSEGSLCNWAASWRCLPEPQSNTANYHKACFEIGINQHFIATGWTFCWDGHAFTLGAYRATAFYQSEGLEPRERRKSEAQQARGNQQDVQQTPRQDSWKVCLSLALRGHTQWIWEESAGLQDGGACGGQTTAQPASVWTQWTAPPFLKSYVCVGFNIWALRM